MSIQAIFELGLYIDKIRNLDINRFGNILYKVDVYQQFPDKTPVFLLII